MALVGFQVWAGREPCFVGKIGSVVTWVPEISGRLIFYKEAPIEKALAANCGGALSVDVRAWDGGLKYKAEFLVVLCHDAQKIFVAKATDVTESPVEALSASHGRQYRTLKFKEYPYLSKQGLDLGWTDNVIDVTPKKPSLYAAPPDVEPEY